MAEATDSTAAAEDMDFMVQVMAPMAEDVGILAQAVATTVDNTDTTENTTAILGIMGIITMDITAVRRGCWALDGVIHGTGIRTICIPTTAPIPIATMDTRMGVTPAATTAATATHMLAMAITVMAVMGTTVAAATMAVVGTPAVMGTTVAIATMAVMGMAAIGPAATMVITKPRWAHRLSLTTSRAKNRHPFARCSEPRLR
jgi:hypothetical protein